MDLLFIIHTMKSLLHTIFFSLTIMLASKACAQDEVNDSLVLHSVFINQLDQEPSYRINIWSEECFRKHSLDISIYKQGRNYDAVIKSITEGIHGEDRNIKAIRKKLSAAGIDSLRAFEQQLSVSLALIYANHGVISGSSDCLNMTGYTVTIGNKSKTFTDWDCRVGFLDRLKKVFSVLED